MLKVYTTISKHKLAEYVTKQGMIALTFSTEKL